MKIAFVTCNLMPEIYRDDALLIPYFEQEGIEVEALPWNDGQANFSNFDCLIVRSSWDYWDYPGHFETWLGKLEREGVRVYNPLQLLRWNMKKHYLRELSIKGVNVVPTLWVKQGSELDLEDLSAQVGGEIVIKPIVSGGAKWTYRGSDSELTQGKLKELTTNHELMVQPFVSEIQTEGELSIMFFGGEFSHAVRKIPAAGDYRTQLQFGALVKLEELPLDMLEQARVILDLLPQKALYARVDGIVVDSKFLLIELELIEPLLYLEWDPEAAARFVNTTISVLEGRSE